MNNYSNLKDKVRMPLYDTVSFSNGAVSAGTDKTFFNIPVGQSSKTYLDTNLETAGQIPYDRIVVYGLRLYLYTRTSTPVNIGDVNQIINCCILDFKKNNVSKLIIPAHWLPAGIGIEGFASTTEEDTSIVSAYNGNASLSNYYRINPEIFSKGEVLQFTLSVKSAMTLTATTYVQLYLESITYKSIS